MFLLVVLAHCTLNLKFCFEKLILCRLCLDFTGHDVEPFGTGSAVCYYGSGLTKWTDTNTTDGLVTLGEIPMQC